MTDPKQLAAALVLELRSPLSRVELAATQLARESPTPAARGLAATISAAVRQADRDIDRILALLAPLAPRRSPCRELGPVLHEVWRRVAPVLDARGTDCALRDPEAQIVRGDPTLASRGALALLRAGSTLVGAGGALCLGLSADGSRYVLRLECRAPDGEGFRVEPERAFSGLLPLAASLGGVLESRAREGLCEAALWLPGETA